MKKFAFVLATVATLSSSGAFAQTMKPMGSGAQAGTYSTYDNFAWGIGLGALAVIGVVVGLSAGAGSQDASSFSH